MGYFLWLKWRFSEIDRIVKTSVTEAGFQDAVWRAFSGRAGQFCLRNFINPKTNLIRPGYLNLWEGPGKKSPSFTILFLLTRKQDSTQTTLDNRASLTDERISTTRERAAGGIGATLHLVHIISPSVFCPYRLSAALLIDIVTKRSI